jgi:hypothetical protein
LLLKKKRNNPLNQWVLSEEKLDEIGATLQHSLWKYPKCLAQDTRVSCFKFVVLQKDLHHINIKFLQWYQECVHSNRVFMASAMIWVGFVCVLLACTSEHMGLSLPSARVAEQLH